MTTEVITKHEQIDRLLESEREALGEDLPAYRGHLLRMYNFLRVLLARELTADPDLENKLAVALWAHDLGIWTAGTWDYLPPSVELVRAELKARGRENWFAEIRAIVENHHKIRSYRGEFTASVEAFRRADLVDLSLGLVRAGLDRKFVSAVRRKIPNRGFHKKLTVLTLTNFLRRPWNPLPMFRW